MTTTWHAPPWQEARWFPEPGTWLENPMRPADPYTLFTPEELAKLLDPPLTAKQIRHLIALVGLKPEGSRHRMMRSGRPPATYDLAKIMKAHAAIVPLLAEFGMLEEPDD